MGKTTGIGNIRNLGGGSGISQRTIERVNKYKLFGQQEMLSLGSTQRGRHAAMKALHPASELGPAQWPDRNTANTVVIENRDIYAIPPPTGLGDNDTWNMNIYILPFPDCVALITRWKTGDSQPLIMEVVSTKVKVTGQDDMWSTPYTMIYSTPWDSLGTYPGNYFQSCRTTARSLTCELDASGLNNSGMLYAGQVGADIQAVPLSAKTVYTNVMQQVYAGLAKLQQGLPLEVAFSQMTLTGEFDSYVDATDSVESEVDDPDGEPDSRSRAPGPPIDKQGLYTVYQDLPDTFQQLGQVDPKWYQSTASEGVYLPLKHTATADVDLEPCAQQYHLCPKIPTDTSNRWGHHVMYSRSWQVGIVMFRNLTKPASINAKFITDIEATAQATSIMAKLAVPPPPCDEKALLACQEVMAATQSAFPASANALGTIVKNIGKALGDAGIPIVSDLANTLTQSQLGGGLLGLLDKLV